MELLYVLLVLLVATRICAEIASRFGQPPLVGELLAGIGLGMVVAGFPEVFVTLGDLSHDKTFGAVADLAIFFLMLLAGVEMRPREVADATVRAVPVAIVGMVLPFALGLALGWYWLPASQWKVAQSMFLGVALAITAVPVSIKVLMDLDKLHTRAGSVIVAAAVTDDILSLILLAVLSSLIGQSEPLSPSLFGMIGLKTFAFFIIAWLVGGYLLPRVGRFLARWQLEHIEFSLLVICGLALAVMAELLGMHFLVGAFTAGVFFTRSIVGEETYQKLLTQIKAITHGFLAPVFFASIGLQLDVSAAVAVPGFIFWLLVAAIAGKLLGAGATARLTGFSGRDSLAIGVAMNARGAVEIIIAGIALQAGLFSRPEPTPLVVQSMFSAIVIVAILTTLAAPVSLRYLLGRDDDDDKSS